MEAGKRRLAGDSARAAALAHQVQVCKDARRL